MALVTAQKKWNIHDLLWLYIFELDVSYELFTWKCMENVKADVSVSEIRFSTIIQGHIVIQPTKSLCGM